MKLACSLILGLMLAGVAQASCQRPEDCRAGCRAPEGGPQDTRWECLESSEVKARAGEGLCRENISGMSCTCMAESCSWMMPEAAERLIKTSP